MLGKKFAFILLLLHFINPSPVEAMNGTFVNGTCFCNCAASTATNATEWSTWFSQGYTIFVCTIIGYETIVKPIAVNYVLPGIKKVFTSCKTCCTKSKKDADEVHKMINDVGFGNPNVRDALIGFTDILKKYIKDHKDQPKLYNTQILTKEFMGVDVPYGYVFNLGPSVKIQVERTVGKMLEKIKMTQFLSQTLVPSSSFTGTDSPKIKPDDSIVIRELPPLLETKDDKEKKTEESKKEAQTKSEEMKDDEKKPKEVQTKKPSQDPEVDLVTFKAPVEEKRSRDVVIDIVESSPKKRMSPSRKKLQLTTEKKPGFVIMYNIKKQEEIIDTARSILNILSEYKTEMDSFKKLILKIGLKGGIQIGKGWDIVDGEKKEYQLVRMGNYEETEDSEVFINPLISIKFYYDPLKCLEYEAELLEKVDKHKSGEGGMTFRGQISKVATDMNDLQALRGLKFQ